MYERMHILTEADKSKIHSATMDILSDIGINFYEPEAVDIFKHHGFRVDGNTVHLEEKANTTGLKYRAFSISGQCKKPGTECNHRR